MKLVYSTLLRSRVELFTPQKCFCCKKSPETVEVSVFFDPVSFKTGSLGDRAS